MSSDGQLKYSVSIIICTYNRAELLTSCLDSIYNQSISADCYEVIVVDNNSLDSTRDVVSGFMQKFKNLQYLNEKNQGLSFCRNAGYRAAQSKYIAYIDDDAMAQPDWIEKIIIFLKDKPYVVAFGGRHAGYCPVEIPTWFPEHYINKSAGNANRPLSSHEWINGTNMIYTKSILEAMHGFNTDLGMKGKKVSYGEETKLQNQIRQSGHEIYYVADLAVKHFVDPRKFSIWWNIKSFYGEGRTQIKTFKLNPQVTIHRKKMFRVFFLELRNLSATAKSKKKIYFSMRNIVLSYGTFIESIMIMLKREKAE